jgi:hypothetical protein
MRIPWKTVILWTAEKLFALAEGKVKAITAEPPKKRTRKPAKK